MIKKFNQLGIVPPTKGFEGDKISLESILDKNIKVLAFELKASKFEKGNDNCLYLQIELNQEKRVFFSGSGNLMEIIKLVNKNDFPFETIITKQNKTLSFT